MNKFISLTGVAVGLVTLALCAPALAKDKNGQSSPSENGLGNAQTEQVLADAIRLCDLMVQDKPAIVDALENEGWTHEILRNIGNSIFYKELSGDKDYPGVGAARIWGFIEDYPGNFIGYCSLTITDPEVRFSISGVNEIDHMVGEFEQEGEEVFGAWRDISSQPSIFIHAYHNLDTFTYQITRINQLEN